MITLELFIKFFRRRRFSIEFIFFDKNKDLYKTCSIILILSQKL